MVDKNLVRTNLDEIARIIGHNSVESRWLAGDGSDRSYFRILEKCNSSEIAKPSGSVVLMQLANSDREKLQSGTYDWVILQEFLSLRDFKVPRILASFAESGEILIEDAGDYTLETCILNLENNGQYEKNALSYYLKAIEMIRGFLKIQESSVDIWTRRAFDSQKFSDELNFFRLHFLTKASGLVFDSQRERTMSLEIDELSNFLASQSKYFVHRDFHSRNLMFSHNELTVIDFQDARMGPAAYDLVSLCFDSYVIIPHSLRVKILFAAFNLLEKDLGVELRVHLESTWRAMLLQRQLKALGSFAYLSIQMQRGDYMKYARPALDTLLSSIKVDCRWPFISGELLQRLDQIY